MKPLSLRQNHLCSHRTNTSDLPNWTCNVCQSEPLISEIYANDRLDAACSLSIHSSSVLHHPTYGVCSLRSCGYRKKDMLHDHLDRHNNLLDGKRHLYMGHTDYMVRISYWLSSFLFFRGKRKFTFKCSTQMC